jgi:hypothetical protein
MRKHSQGEKNGTWKNEEDFVQRRSAASTWKPKGCLIFPDVEVEHRKMSDQWYSGETLWSKYIQLISGKKIFDIWQIKKVTKC